MLWLSLETLRDIYVRIVITGVHAYEAPLGVIMEVDGLILLPSQEFSRLSEK